MIGTEEFNDAVMALNDLADADDSIEQNSVRSFIEEFDIDIDAFNAFLILHADLFIRRAPQSLVGILGLGTYSFQVGFLIGRSSIQNGTSPEAQ